MSKRCFADHCVFHVTLSDAAAVCATRCTAMRFSAAERRYVIKPSTGKDFVETFLGVAADVKNETGSIYYKLFKVCQGSTLTVFAVAWD